LDEKMFILVNIQDGTQYVKAREREDIERSKQRSARVFIEDVSAGVMAGTRHEPYRFLL
jgi:hypothetical protein